MGLFFMFPSAILVNRKLEAHVDYDVVVEPYVGVSVLNIFYPKNGSGGLYVCLQSTRLEDLCKIPDYICISNKEPATRHVGTYSQQVMK